MQTGIHPNYQQSQVICACGNQFQTRSTVSILKVDICNQCHPFFTGQQKLLDSAGRVEKFSKRFAKTGGKTVEREKAVQKKIASPLLKTPKVNVLTTAPTAAKKDKDKKKAH